MYRNYEDPWKLEKRLQKAKEYLHIAQLAGDEDAIIDYTLEVEELKDRINFAWQDQEYDETYNGGEFEW